VDIINNSMNNEKRAMLLFEILTLYNMLNIAFCSIFYLVFSVLLSYIGNMTITQTVKIPADRRITLDVPPQIMAGEMARFEVIWFPVKKTVSSLDNTLKTIQELCKDIPVSSDSLREERRRDLEKEEVKYGKFMSGFGARN